MDGIRTLIISLNTPVVDLYIIYTCSSFFAFSSVKNRIAQNAIISSAHASFQRLPIHIQPMSYNHLVGSKQVLRCAYCDCGNGLNGDV